MIGIIEELIAQGTEVWIFEPMILHKNAISGTVLCNDLKKLYDKCDIILANRVENDLLPYIDKVYTRDIFERD